MLNVVGTNAQIAYHFVSIRSGADDKLPHSDIRICVRGNTEIALQHEVGHPPVIRFLLCVKTGCHIYLMRFLNRMSSHIGILSLSADIRRYS